MHPPSSPEDAKRLAELTLAWALDGGFTLDCSPESLDNLDRLLCGFHTVAGLQAQGQLSADTDEQTAFVVAWANLAGCYLGEVIIRIHGGVWRRTEETEWRKIAGMSRFPLVLQLPSGIICSPLSKPFKVLDTGRAESLSDFYQAVTSA
jgi:hypothetical protein